MAGWTAREGETGLWMQRLSMVCLLTATHIGGWHAGYGAPNETFDEGATACREQAQPTEVTVNAIDVNTGAVQLTLADESKAGQEIAREQLLYCPERESDLLKTSAPVNGTRFFSLDPALQKYVDDSKAKVYRGESRHNAELSMALCTLYWKVKSTRVTVKAQSPAMGEVRSFTHPALTWAILFKAYEADQDVKNKENLRQTMNQLAKRNQAHFESGEHLSAVSGQNPYYEDDLHTDTTPPCLWRIDLGCNTFTLLPNIVSDFSAQPLYDEEDVRLAGVFLTSDTFKSQVGIGADIHHILRNSNVLVNGMHKNHSLVWSVEQAKQVMNEGLMLGIDFSEEVDDLPCTSLSLDQGELRSESDVDEVDGAPATQTDGGKPHVDDTTWQAWTAHINKAVASSQGNH